MQYVRTVTSKSIRLSYVKIAAISAGGHPGLAKDLYLYLISRPEYQTPEQRQALMRRLREALVKLVSVVGVPKPLEAIFCMAEVEREEDKDYSFSRYVISNHYLLCLFRFQEGPAILFKSSDPPFAFGNDLGISSIAPCVDARLQRTLELRPREPTTWPRLARHNLSTQRQPDG